MENGCVLCGAAVNFAILPGYSATREEPGAMDEIDDIDCDCDCVNSRCVDESIYLEMVEVNIKDNFQYPSNFRSRSVFRSRNHSFTAHSVSSSDMSPPRSVRRSASAAQSSSIAPSVRFIGNRQR